MTKTHTIETIEEYDSNGKLIRKTTTETNEENNRPSYIYDNFWWPRWNNGPTDKQTMNQSCHERSGPQCATECP